MNRHENLAKTVKNLMLKEPFYGIFALSLNKEFNKDKVPTAGVAKMGINYKLCINPEFWDGLEPNVKEGILKHELMHIAFFHLYLHDGYSDKELFNVATDMEINQYIDREDLPQEGIFIENYAELNLELKAGSDYYYKALQKAQEEYQKKGSCGCPGADELFEQMDNGGQLPCEHPTWKEFEGLSDADKQLLKRQTVHLLKETESASKTRGNIPGKIAELLELLQDIPPKFDWRQYLRRFTGGSIIPYTKKLRRKYNKRYEDNPGLKIKYHKHLLVAIDTSGSVNKEELEEFVNELVHIHKTGGKITVAQTDAAISSIEEFNPRKKEFTIHGRGGTDFQPIIDYYRENLKKYTALIFFTDGEAPAPIDVKGKVLWVVSSVSTHFDHLPGQVVKLEEKETNN
jgi:predicted metal-dependent peptidase